MTTPARGKPTSNNWDRRDRLAAELRETYPVFVAKLVDLLRRIEEVDEEVDRINRAAPRGECRRLDAVELAAPDLDSFTARRPSITKGSRTASGSSIRRHVTGNPFVERSRLIMRLDMAARSETLQAKLQAAPDWDLVVCDEAHRMAASLFGTEVKYTKRYKLGQLAGEPCAALHAHVGDAAQRQ